MSKKEENKTFNVEGGYKQDPLLIPSRHKLFEAIQNGDEAAFAEYYNGFVDSLMNFIRKLVGNLDEAKEIVQDVFIKLWENRGNIDPDRQLDSFIYTTAKNLALNVIKKRQIHSKYIDDHLFTSQDLHLPADEDMISKETALLINLVIYGMPPQRRKVFELSRKEGLTYEEIAKHMGISLDTVKSHMKLALKNVRDALIVFISMMLIH